MILPARSEQMRKSVRRRVACIVLSTDAVQLEFSGDYRAKRKREKKAKKIANAAEEYTRRYLQYNPEKPSVAGQAR